MKLIFEKSVEGRGADILPQETICQVNFDGQVRSCAPKLPQVSEQQVSRHYSELSKRAYGVNDGFYPLGSCTMKYNPKVNEALAALPRFTQIHPLQPAHTAQGCLEVFELAEKRLCELTGMDAMTFQPAAGAHGEFTGLLLIKAYHESKGDFRRTKILVPDSAHGTNPASAVMAGFQTVNIPSDSEGCVDLEKLREAVGEDTAGLMLTNPNTMGIFDKNILQITEIVKKAGGLNYYDGANLNAIMGWTRPGDMGFDVVHLNLHKTFSTPHGGGGPGSGPVGCKEYLSQFLPGMKNAAGCLAGGSQSVGSVKTFYGNFLVVVKALAYLMSLGADGIKESSLNAVLNANYLKKKLEACYPMAVGGLCMHEFVMDLSAMKEKMGISAMDVAKALLDAGIHPPTMYFPLIVHEALMVEPTETEGKETLDEAAEAFREIFEKAKTAPEMVREAPASAVVGRPDEVRAARTPILRCKMAGAAELSGTEK